MSIPFWRKTRDTKTSANPESVPVDENNPLPVRPMSNEDDDPQRVQITGEFQPAVAGQTLVREVQIPGIGTGSPYTAGDAFGTLIVWRDVFRPEKASGRIVGAYIIDKDDEGIQVDIPLFTRSITATADNSAFAPTDSDLEVCRGVVSITEFFNWLTNQFGQATNLGIWIKGSGPHLYSQCVVQGAANIAAGSIPIVGLIVDPD